MNRQSWMARLAVAVLLAIGLFIPAVVELGAAPSDLEGKCAGMGGTWNGFNTCTILSGVNGTLSTGLVVQSNYLLVVESGASLSVNSDMYLSAGGLSISGTLTVAEGRSVYVQVESATGSEGFISNYGAFTNNGTLAVGSSSAAGLDAMFYNRDTGTFTNSATGIVSNSSAGMDNHGTFVNSGSVWNNAADATSNKGIITTSGLFQNELYFFNKGTLSVVPALGVDVRLRNTSTGEIDVMDGGSILTYSATNFDNEGTIDADSSASLSLYTLTNSGHFITDGDMRVHNMTNATGGTFTNYGNLGIDDSQSPSITNDGTLRNYGTLTFDRLDGNLRNNNEFQNMAGGVVDNAGNVDNDGTVHNRGSIANRVGQGFIQNDNIIYNYCGSTWLPRGRFSGNSPIDMCVPPEITSDASTTFEVGSYSSFTVAATGSPTITFYVSGTLPSGVGFNGSTGVLSGTPAKGTGGNTYNITFNARNGVSPDDAQAFALTVAKRAITVEADPQTKAYGDADPSPLTYQVTSGSLMAGDAFSGSLTREGGEDLGPHAIQQGSLSLSNDYILSFTENDLTITPKQLTVSGITASNKVYDGDATATLDTSGESLVGVVGGEDVTLNTSGATGAFADKHVGNGKTVTVSGLYLEGDDVGHYTLASVTTSADITPLALDMGALAWAKEYDGTATASVLLWYDPVDGDDLGLSYTTASFSDKNVGVGKTVTVSGISLTGADAGNYTCDTTTTTSANITSRTLTVDATAGGKEYDGTTTAAVTLDDDRLSGDVFSFTYAAAFSDKNVGVGKTVTVSGITPVGADAGNYTLASASVTTTADIWPRAITVTADEKTKTFGQADPPLTYQFTVGALAAGDSLSGEMARVPGEDVGDYPIEQNTLAASSNYDLTYVGDNLHITQATPLLALSAAPSPSVIGQSVTLGVGANWAAMLRPGKALAVSAVCPMTGDVTFMDGTNVLGTGSFDASCRASLTTAALSVGAHTLTAEYPGDANFVAGTSNDVSHQVNQAGTTTTITAHTPNPSTVGQAVTVSYNVTVNSPGLAFPDGTVTITAGAASCTGPAPSGSCQLTFGAAGTATLVATYSGDTELAGTASAPVTHTISLATCTPPAPSIRSGGLPHHLFLPFVRGGGGAGAPNLIVQSIVPVSNTLQVTLANQGAAAVTSDFWVDLYINPNPGPTHVNQTWGQLASQGAVWGVTAAGLPALAPSGTLTLSTGGAYYWPTLSKLPTSLPAGTCLYVQVDSANAGTTYGAVRETHEWNGGPYDNITIQMLASPASLSLSAGARQAAPSNSRLPQRSK